MRTSLRWPITLGVIMIVLVVALIVGWVAVTVLGTERSGAYWALMAVGTTFLVLVLVGVVLYLLISIKEIRLNRRQSNFIDSVSHELKSPIASLKLCLQTLSRRNVDEQRQADFYRFMLDDVARLDNLINHMLDAARLDQQPVEADIVDVDLAAMLKACAQTVCARYHLPSETVQLRLEPAIVRGRPIDLEMIFRNLIDNAIKYAGEAPLVEVELQLHRPSWWSRGSSTTAGAFRPSCGARSLAVSCGWEASWSGRKPAPGWDCSSSAIWSNDSKAVSWFATATVAPEPCSKCNCPADGRRAATGPTA